MCIPLSGYVIVFPCSLIEFQIQRVAGISLYNYILRRRMILICRNFGGFNQISLRVDAILNYLEIS